ncbi:MAG: HAMP domain-containing histidine kinase [Muribaculum sp.]|nr:HAMP domain-containing histidine kinase [Muribaculum sp.]
MIRQLRKKFILVAMGSLFVVLAVIVGSLNAAGYYGTVERADRILNMLAENEGHFPDDYPGRKQTFPEERELSGGTSHSPRVFKESGMFRGLSPETPYDTRFFSVRMDGQGTVISVDTGRIAAVETAEAMAYAEEVWTSGRKSGFLENYRFLNQRREGTQECRVIFVDCGRELNSVRNLLFTSIGVSALGMLAVFVLVLVFSRRVFAPVEESYVKQRRFVTDASHELKTPLAVISADVDILELEGQRNQWTDSIRNQVKRLGGLTEQMVALSKLEEEEKPVLTRCCLSQIAEETAALFAPLAQAQEKKLSLEIREGIYCMGDAGKLGQMLSLLLDNALKYASAQGEIRLTVETVKKGGRARIVVWNTVGEESGIAPGRLDMLFERFYRPDASRNSGIGGSGIGLSIVKAIAKQHGGKVAAESADGKSVAFEVWLPFLQKS